jgi:pyridoxamine 5'-phosphate oxidase
MMIDPLEIFRNGYDEELSKSRVRLPSACCLGTIGLDGYPNSRFVSLKEVRGEDFIFTGPLNSGKGQELLKNPKVSLTFWWTETERQVRVQGVAVPLSNELADSYFKDRNKDAQVLAYVSEQGKPVDDLNGLADLFEARKQRFAGEEITRPAEWSGFSITPVRIEFMAFKESRFHIRELYYKEDGEWQSVYLQP